MKGAVTAAAAAPTAAMPAPILIWPGGAPDAKGSAEADKPAVYPYLPAAGLHSGSAVVIVAGTGSAETSTDPVGAQIAARLNEQGIAGFVLRYRTKPYDPSASVADVNRAVRTVRARAAEFHLSPQRVAVLGFGAGAELAADAAYNHGLEADAAAADAVHRVGSRPDLLALIWGSPRPVAGAPTPLPTFLIGSTRARDGMSDMVELWTKLRAARVPVDAHFFAKFDASSALSTWPELFYAWARFQGFLTDAPRVRIKGTVFVDGHVLPHGYVIFTPIGFVGAGPVAGRVFNSTANEPIGQFSVPANQGPVPGRYNVDVRQNMTRWLSNSFSAGLVNARSGGTPEQAHFGHHRVLAPSIEDQRSFTKARPLDREDMVMEIQPGAEANMDLKIEVFTK